MDDFERMAAAATLIGMMKQEPVIKPIEVYIGISENSVKGGVKINKPIIRDLGEKGFAWVEETNKLILPIIEEQTTKFTKILNEEWGVHFCGEFRYPNADSDSLRESLFGGAKLIRGRQLAYS